MTKDHLAQAMIREYRRLCEPGVAYLAMDMKVALLAWAAVNVQGAQANPDLPIGKFTEAYHKAYDEIFGNQET
jgi:glycerol uptake facilitator-like aquaporin